MPSDVIWVIDTSSVAEIRRSIENSRKIVVFEELGRLVRDGRLFYPKQVVQELERSADPRNPHAQYQWASQHEGTACKHAPSMAEIKAILAAVPTVLDPDKDVGVEEADPYILACGVRLLNQDHDARIVTEEKNDTPRKLSLRTAAGLVRLPSVPLRAFLQFEKIF